MDNMETIIPKYILIYKDLNAFLKNSTFEYGDKIGTEEQLCEKYNVSRITIKKALDMLENDGIIYRVKGKGIFYKKQETNSADKTNYILADETSNLIGFIHESGSASFGDILTKSLVYNATTKNYNVILKYTFGNVEVENRAIDELLESNIKGLIITPAHGEYYNPKILKLVLDGFPIVLIDKFFKGINVPVVSIDHKKAMKDLTRFLIDNNHIDIAVISSRSQNTTSIEERIIGYIEELAYCKIKFEKDNILQDIPFINEDIGTLNYSNDSANNETRIDYFCQPGTLTYDSNSIENAVNIIADFIKRRNKVTAFICINYMLASLTYIALKKLGISVPEDKSIVCFDAIDNTIYPIINNFTCIKQDEIAIGRIAIETIDKLIKGEEISEKRLYAGYQLIDYGTVRKLDSNF